jgi:hypothetical protein
VNEWTRSGQRGEAIAIHGGLHCGWSELAYALVNFLTIDADGWGSLDADSNLVAPHGSNDDANSAVDYDFFTHPSSENQHDFPSLIQWWFVPGSIR